MPPTNSIPKVWILTPFLYYKSFLVLKCPQVAVLRSYPNNERPPYTSGGGFSNYFKRPQYQDKAISKYLLTHVGDRYHGLYNPSGRGIPDVAAQGLNFGIIWNGKLVPVGGTSAATPAMASVIALVNDALVAAEKSPLGFLNV